MSNRNRSQASPSMAPCERIRRLWPEFRQSVSKSRTLLEHKVEAQLDKAEKEYEKTAPERRRPVDQHNAHKARLAKESREPHFKAVRHQWELKLQELGLRMEDWTDISSDEMASVLDVLGNPEDEADNREAVVVATDRQSPPHQTFSSASLASYVTSPPQPLAPALSSSTRSTNVSTASSYAFVDPSEFHSEEEDPPFFFPVATSYDLTSDDDDRPVRPRQNHFDSWSSDSSHHSFDGPLTTRFPSSTLSSNPRKMTSAGKQAASLKTKGELVQKARQSYVGPTITDPDEPLSEEEDFERFKMNVRFQKIIQFHQAAAHADIELAIAVYKDRIAQNSDNNEVSSKVTNHQKRMMQLQMEKEEERKNIVKAERSKRRSELRRRPGRSGTLIAPRPSVPANPSWLNAFHEQVTGEVESNIVLDKILSNNPDEQEGNVEKLLEQMFPGSSANEDNFAPAVSQRDYTSSTGLNGWRPPTTSISRSPDVNHEPSPVNPPKKLLNGRSKHNNTRFARPSLFGEDPESSDDDEDSPSPPASVPAHQPANPFMNADADSMLTHHLMADPQILYSYMNQWGTTGELPGLPSPTASWATSQAMQTPTVDNPDPWKLKDVRSTPVATRRRSSLSAPLLTPTQNAHNAFMAEQSMPLATLAALNSAHANGREKQPAVLEERRFLEPFKRFSPPQPTPAPVSIPSVASSSAQLSTSPATQQTKADADPTPILNGKKPNKKQRQAMKKAGGSSNSIDDFTPAPEFPAPPPETTPMATILEQPPPPGNRKSTSPQAQVEANLNAGVGRGRKDSTSTWGELLSTPRPTSNIPAHLRDKLESAQQKPVEQLRSTSGMSTIRAPQRGSALKNRTAWSIFPSGEPGPSRSQVETGGHDPWLPGSFEVNDRGGGGGGDQEDQMASFSARFFGAAPSASNKSVPVTMQASLPNNPSPSDPKATASQHQPPSLSPTSRKGKNKKGKGKKVTVEEVEEDDQDSRGERLPIDHRYILESNSTTILEQPKPKVAPRMFDSIFGFGDDDNTNNSGEGTGAGEGDEDEISSSAETGGDPFDGDAARLVAAMQEIQAASARMEKKFVSTPVWGVSPNGNGNSNGGGGGGGVRPEATPPMFAWGQPPIADRRRAGGGGGGVNPNASNLVGNNNLPNGIPKPVIAPAIQNLKRSKAASGGKLL